MEFVESDKELALIIGHELAHNTMGHIRKALGNYVVTLGGTRYTRPFESEADYVGLLYGARRLFTRRRRGVLEKTVLAGAQKYKPRQNTSDLPGPLSIDRSSAKRNSRKTSRRPARLSQFS